MMGGGMVLGEVITKVACPLAPVDCELFLSNSVADPIEAHIDGFGLALFDCVSGNPHRSAVVRDNGRRRLGMPKFNEGCAHRDCVLTVVE